MRLCFFNDDRLGLVLGDVVLDVTTVLAALPSARYPRPQHDVFIERLPALREKIERAAGSAQRHRLEHVKLSSPVLNPGKLVAAPVNYQKHLDEALAEPKTFLPAHARRIQETGLFLKATSSLIGPAKSVVIWHAERRTDHEVELAVVIGKECRRVSRATAFEYVAGYCVGLDITLRGPEERSLRKSLDTYSVLGPWLVTADEVQDPGALELSLDVNGEPRQRANTRDLILSIPELIELASSFYTLVPGDILFTGTPEGVGPIAPGDVIQASIHGVGSMRVTVSSGK
jgi:2-keto-4-pentenoate hydratase/2-oxohepta-3-ene-1,7-dioic acid hydratase in catechol pathway